jgi:hypothetical protein
MIRELMPEVLIFVKGVGRKRKIGVGVKTANRKRNYL